MINRLAAIGLVIGLVAVSMAAFRNNFIYPAPALEPDRSFKAVATEAAKKILEEKVLRKKQVPQDELTDRRHLPLHPYEMTYTGLGLLAFGLGITAWCRKEHVRLAGAATAIGLVAVCWEWTVLGVCIAVVIWVLSNL